MKSLRGQLVFFWVLLATVCVALAVVMTVLFRSTAGAQIDNVQALAEQACTTVAARYAKSLANPQQATPQLDLLQVLLQLVLLEAPHVEGGIWRMGAGSSTDDSSGFLAYAYPTYEGSGAKHDVPEAEQAHIATIAQVAARTQRLQTDVVRASREALVLVACPLQAPGRDLVAWTMTRTSLATLDAQRSLRIGLGVLLAVVLASGLWLGSILLRGYRHVQRLERQLASDDVQAPPQPLAPTGVLELDRIVAALDQHRHRLDEARTRLRDAERQQARDQRLATLGRMTGSMAHEIRNPIAAMRLKAENALAGPADRQPAALQLILEQIARLDALVQSLLATVQPINLALRRVQLQPWLAEHVAAVTARAADRGVRVDVHSADLSALVDPVHLGRAVDNLLDNAVRHARSAVTVTLLHDAARGLLLRVDDDGAGVAAALRNQLFEPFASGRADGTGLGLALAREVALAHGGNLSHLPRQPGTRFELELPWRDS